MEIAKAITEQCLYRASIIDYTVQTVSVTHTAYNSPIVVDNEERIVYVNRHILRLISKYPKHSVSDVVTVYAVRTIARILARKHHEDEWNALQTRVQESAQIIERRLSKTFRTQHDQEVIDIQEEIHKNCLLRMDYMTNEIAIRYFQQFDPHLIDLYKEIANEYRQRIIAH